MNLGISTASMYPLEPEKALEQLCKWGIPYAEIFINAQSELETSYIKELRKVADDFNLKVVSLHPFSSGYEPMMFFTDYPRRFKDSLDNYRVFFQAMNYLGAEIFVFHGDTKLNPMPNQEVYERYDKLCQVGEEFGIIVAHENVDRCKGHDINFFVEMKKYLNKEISLVFDNKQAVRGKVDYREFIDKLGENIVHVHLSDSLGAGNKECCVPIGKGNADILDLLSRLKAKNYNKAVLIELYNDVLENNDEIFESYKNLIALCDKI